MSTDVVDWLSSRPTRRGETVSRGEETVVYNVETGGLHALNPSALAIWELCDGETTGAEMAEAVTELAGLDPRAAQSDVSSTLEQLHDLGLIDRVGPTKPDQTINAV